MSALPRYDGSPIMSIEGAPDDQIAPLVRQRRRFEAMLADLSNDEWSSASRCEGWTVQDVVAHLVGVNRFWHASVVAGLSGSPTQVLTRFDPATTPAVMVAQMREFGPADILDQFVASNDSFLGVLDAIDHDGWAMLAEAPPGHLPIRLLAHHALWDSWIHERDIAFPLGLTPPTEADEIRSCLCYVAALSAALAVGSDDGVAGAYAIRGTDPTLHLVLDVGECVVVRDDVGLLEAPCLRGDAVALVEAVSVRSPVPTSIPTEWQQLLEGLSNVFKPTGSDQ